MTRYSHYCSLCKKYWPCSHDDPEKQTTIGPCGHILLLAFKNIETLKEELSLGLNELGEGNVRYKTL